MESVSPEILMEISLIAKSEKDKKMMPLVNKNVQCVLNRFEKKSLIAAKAGKTHCLLEIDFFWRLDSDSYKTVVDEVRSNLESRNFLTSNYYGGALYVSWKMNE